MMQRRTFFSAMGTVAMTASAQDAARKTKYFRLERFVLEAGDQGARLAEYLQRGRMEACARLGAPGPRIVLEGLITAHSPQTVVITPYASLDEMRSTEAKLAGDGAHRAAVEKWEAPAAPPYTEVEEILLEATDYNPELPAVLPKREAPRVFELRLYHSPTLRQARGLHERFAGPEMKIFHRCGIHPVLYSTTAIGPRKPNLVYLTPFDDLAAREKAWAAFGADEEWIKVRKESIEKYGQSNSGSQISIYRAAAYSPLR
jgi:hypothetical protein